MILRREVQKIRSGKWEELEELEKKWQELERRAGHPEGKKRYRGMSAPHDLDTMIIEVEWECLAAISPSIHCRELPDIASPTTLLPRPVEQAEDFQRGLNERSD